MKSETKELIRSLRKIHAVISISLALVALASYAAMGGSLNSAGTSFVYLNAIIPIVFALVAFAGWRINKTRLKKIEQLETEKEKLEAYRKLQILQYGLLEAAFFLAIIVFVQTRELNYIIYSVLMLIYMIYIRPNKLKIKQDLGIDLQED